MPDVWDDEPEIYDLLGWDLCGERRNTGKPRARMPRMSRRAARLSPAIHSRSWY
jgi:hypothetical protein